LQTLRVDFSKACQVVNMLCEGVGIRATSRLAGVDQKTVLNILEAAGAHCLGLLDEKVRGVQCESVQCDELFAFVFCKEANNRFHDEDRGTQFTFLAVDRESKLILSHLIGRRDRPQCDLFMADLRKRIKGRCQLTTDGYTGYITAVFKAFYADVDFAQQIKTFNDYGHQDPKANERRYSAPHGVTSVKTFVRTGSPNRRLISTSHVERTNLSVRLFNKRFARLTLGYSKKLENLKLATALFIAHFNFCRVHSTHGKTPAMAAGLTDKVWNIAELLASTT
jgi:IS1 family transposase